MTAADVSTTLSRVPAPRVIALQGSVPIVTMEPFVAFLEAMGYPAAQLEQPGSPARSYSSFVDTRRLAGHLAWHYEQEGLMPMLIGHSQGGMIVVKVLHDLAASQDAAPIPVWNPLRDAPEPRTDSRRSAYRRIAPGHRIEGRLCDCAGHGIVAASAARTVGHPSVVARRAGLGRRLHRVFDSLGCDRGHRSEPDTVSRDRDRTRAQRRAARVVQSHRASARRRISRRTRRRARGSTAIVPGRRRRFLRTPTRRTCCSRPTSGTA